MLKQFYCILTICTILHASKILYIFLQFEQVVWKGAKTNTILQSLLTVKALTENLLLRYRVLRTEKTADIQKSERKSA